MAYQPRLPNSMRAPELVPVASRTEAEEEAWWAAVTAARRLGDLDPQTQLEAAYADLQADATPANCAAYALAAIGARLPFYGGGDVDLGAAGWRQWAGIGDGADDTATVDGDAAGLETAVESGPWHS